MLRTKDFYGIDIEIPEEEPSRIRKTLTRICEAEAPPVLYSIIALMLSYASIVFMVRASYDKSTLCGDSRFIEMVATLLSIIITSFVHLWYISKYWNELNGKAVIEALKTLSLIWTLWEVIIINKHIGVCGH